MSNPSFSRSSSSLARDTKRISEITENFISRANSPTEGPQKICNLSDHLVNLQKFRSETPSIYCQRKQEPRAKDKQLSDLIRKIGHLNSEKAELELRNRTLLEENQELKGSLQRADLEIKKLKVPTHTQKPTEANKYLKFIALRMNEAPQFKQLILDRIGSFKDFAQVFNERNEDCSVKLLQILSDLCVKELTHSVQDNSTQTKTVIKNTGKDLETDSNQVLIQNIEKQSERIAFLNKQIADAMASKRPLLEQVHPNKTNININK